MQKFSRALTKAVFLAVLALSASARRLAEIPSGSDSGDNPHTCCRCKCVVAADTTNSTMTTAPPNNAPESGTNSSTEPPSNTASELTQLPCFDLPWPATSPLCPSAWPGVNGAPGMTNRLPPSYGKKAICKSGFIGSCNDVCEVDYGGYRRLYTC